MKNLLFGLIALFCLTSLIFVSCEKDEEICSVCSFERPTDGMIQESGVLCADSESALAEAEQAYRENEVFSVGGDWVNLEVTCTRQ